MQIKFMIFPIILLLVLLSGCEKPEQSAEKPESQVFSAQKEAIDKAKQVEGVIMQGEEREREEMDQQSQ